MRLVILESPFSNSNGKTVEENIAYARKCVKDLLHRDESCQASHLLYTQEGILDDTVSAERALGMEAGHQWIRVADAMVVYVDHGISSGMILGIKRAQLAHVKVEFRSLVLPHLDSTAYLYSLKPSLDKL